MVPTVRPDWFHVIAVPESADQTRIAELLSCRSNILAAKGADDVVFKASESGIRRSRP